MTTISTHHAVDTIFVSRKFCDLYGIVRIGDIPDTNVRHVTTFSCRQKFAISSECQGSYGLATGIQHVRLSILPWIEQYYGTAATRNHNSMKSIQSIEYSGKISPFLSLPFSLDIQNCSIINSLAVNNKKIIQRRERSNKDGVSLLVF